jgi:anti-anti-sigma regulatory factor
MEKGKKRQAGSGTRHWQGALTVQRVVALKEELFLGLDELDKILINLSGATEIDPACMQLLCSAHRTAISLNKELALIGGGHLAEAMREAGFLRHIGCALDCNHSCLWVNRNQSANSPARKEG